MSQPQYFKLQSSDSLSRFEREPSPSVATLAVDDTQQLSLLMNAFQSLWNSEHEPKVSRSWEM
jgi:hypothetical protein